MPTNRRNTGRPRGARPAAAVLAGVLATGFTVATGASSAANADTAAPICTSDAHPEVAKKLGAAIQQAADQRKGRIAVGVSAYDGDLTCGLNPQAEFDAASVGKVVILGTLLRTAMDEGRELTAKEKELATDMITVSGNDSTVELRDQLGAKRIQRFLDLAGMDATTLHPKGSVGLMKINTTDELTLLRLLRTDNDVLGAAQRDYARKLMGDVVADQRWGVPTGAPADAGVYLKNGWLPYDNTDTWRVNSIGGFQGTPIGDYEIVVLTDDNAGMQYGVDTIESVGTKVHSVLNGDSSLKRLTGRDLPEEKSDGSDRT
ncbi:beta-lactamase class A [Murinocardiopsis flavida]|uniref:Beta-lactamase class A n=1 Tax=Murinocardiopsis flavida TaxID=645275 RepID=A0A2P8CLZ7_9ACTN|nr:serine hydrolase [Murinocardiopsis flavida]PSK85977.1 beta-lactamase class A [Murinocardiopsis flavida]